MNTLPLKVLFAGALFACGERPLAIPSPLPGPVLVDAHTGDLARGRAALRDRTLGRTGFACADCHRTGEAERLRPAPPINTATPSKVHYCVERYLGRSALSTAQMTDVLRATAQAPPQSAPSAGSGKSIYDEGCRHCHERGPAGPLLERPFSPGPLRKLIRGHARATHPNSLMPSFSAKVLSNSALDALVEAMVTTRAGDHLDDQ